MNAKTCMHIERRIAKAAAEGLIAAGYQIEVFDGRRFVLEKTADLGAILDAMFATDEDCFFAYRKTAATGATWEHAGWVYFVHGLGVDVLADYEADSDLGAALRRANELAEQLEQHYG